MVKDDLVLQLEQMLQKQPFDHIVIELSGLADPGPLIQIFWSDTELEADVYLDAVVCLCDAQHIVDHLKNTTEAAQQIAMVRKRREHSGSWQEQQALLERNFLSLALSLSLSLFRR